MPLNPMIANLAWNSQKISTSIHSSPSNLNPNLYGECEIGWNGMKNDG